MATRDQIDRAVRDMLATGTGKQFGLVDPPAEIPTMPYGVLLPMITSEGNEDMEDVWREEDCLYNVICAGKDARQAGAMGSSVKAVMLSKTGSSYVHPLVLPGASVMWRLMDSRGAIVHLGTVYQSTDSYRIRVGP